MISATPEQTEFTGQIHKIALDHVIGDADFEPAWKRFLVEFQHWTTQSYAQNTSSLNVKLGFLQMLLKHFPSLGVFGVLYTMKTPNGSLVSFEFFD